MGWDMELFYAHYPSLEKSFLNYVAAERKNPLEPWLVVCASSFLAQRLAACLARENGVVANIHFITGSTLLYRLDSEAGPEKPPFPQDHLRDFLLKEILKEPGLDRYASTRGFVQALKNSLRDLADSLADPAVLEEHLQTTSDSFLEQDYERLRWLLNVYRRYTEREAQVPGYRPYQALFERALAQIKKSIYLKTFKRLIWYGFYDMPGRQLEVVNELKTYYPLTVFAPYASYPGYRFAKKFFETNWLGATSQVTDVEQSLPLVLTSAQNYLFASQGSVPTQGIKIVSAADPAGEVFFVAKEILRLVEQEGFQFEDIAVLTRTLSSYQEEVRHTFAQNYIPLNASFSYPISKFPLGIFCLNLFSLVANGFDRETILAILASPYFKNPRKFTWRALAARSLAKRDLNQWRDLLPHTVGFDPALLDWMERCQAQLADLERPQRWETAAAKAFSFLKENVDQTVLSGKEIEIFEAVCEQISSLATYGTLRAESRLGEFVRELLDALNAICFNEVEAVKKGVTFTDVLRGRGLQFKVVFLVGLNEKNFPLLYAEDPILRDRYRYVLRDVLGYWINQQVERADEERLLFFTAVTSAQQRLYLSYAHTAPDGKESVPSVYLAELARAAQLDWKATAGVEISGRVSERISTVNTDFLTPKEISCSLIADLSHASTHYQQAGLWSSEKERALQAAQQFRSLGDLTPHDGILSSGKMIFSQTDQGAGFSPSALQELASCPMKYFFNRGLHLEEVEEPLSRRELSADRQGTAYHEVLQSFYQALLRQGITHQLSDSAVEVHMERALAKHYTQASGQRFGIYPLVWELILEEMRTQLTAFAQEDIKQLGEFTPTFFEQAFSQVRVPGIPFSLQGIMDRIDLNEKEKTFIVADYKSSKKGGNDLARVFFTHLIFQPFLYVLAAMQLPLLKQYKSAGSCLLSIHKKYCRRDLLVPQWEELRPQAERFLTLLADLIKKGQFFLNPSEACQYCPYGTICRKDSFACLMRARKSAPSRQLEEVRHV